MGTRRTARECALQMLYQWDLTRDDIRRITVTYWEVHAGDEDVRNFADRLAGGVVEHVDTIDPLIQRHAKNWRLDRMETVDRNLLRLAAEELLFHEETPATVVINEAIEIARRYSTAGSPQFINGLLDNIRREIEKEKD